MAVKRGDVVLMVAPGDLGKPRPGVVVQSDELGDSTSTVLICPMSSDIQTSPRLRPVVEPSATNGLRIQSQIMTEKLMPVRRDRIRRVLGSLDPLSVDQLDRALLVVLGLAYSQ
jgi:mRNA interferase MazF